MGTRGLFCRLLWFAVAFALAGCGGRDGALSAGNGGGEPPGGSIEGGGVERYAETVEVQRVAPEDAPWEVEGIETMESFPLQFALRLARTFPTPGFDVRAEAPEIDRPGSYPVHITATPPSGIVTQVLTPVTVRVPLGKLRPGSYELVVLEKRSGAEDFERVQTIELVAK